MTSEKQFPANRLNAQITLGEITTKAVLATNLRRARGTASVRQLHANRQNAQKSTGPNTAEGKARSSQNALKHGLTAARAWLLPHESWREFRAFWTYLVAAFDPQDAIELLLVERPPGQSKQKGE